MLQTTLLSCVRILLWCKSFVGYTAPILNLFCWQCQCHVNTLQVRIVGWGQHPPHWVVANTWGRSWGEQGLLRIRRGDNTARCRQILDKFSAYQIFLWFRIEEMVTAAWPGGRSPRRHRRRRGRGRGRRRGHWDRGWGDGWRWLGSEERSINEVSTECRTMRLQSTQLLTCLPLFLQRLLMEGRMCGCFVFTRMCDRGNINKVLVVSNVMCRY